MRSNRLATYLALACLAGVPATAAIAHADATAETTPGPRPASADELSSYAEREEKAKDLEEFEGGRRRGGTEATTIVIILLVVILVVLLI
jgi:hypothetical protein